MAKRKAASARKRSGSGAARTAAARKRTAGKSRKSARKAAAPKASARKTAARKAARKSTSTAKAAGRKASSARKTASAAKTAKAAKTARSSRTALPPKTVVARKTPALDRPRRTITDDIEPTPPSSLDLDRTASAVRTGRRAMKERYAEHTETSPALTAGDVDADWESAYSVGDEAPGGDNPTPDQDIVDDIGRAVGNEYQDNEELKGADKITKRDKHRWELDPASSEDYDDRD